MWNYKSLQESETREEREKRRIEEATRFVEVKFEEFREKERKRLAEEEKREKEERDQIRKK